jgi:hypothetical protein
LAGSGAVYKDFLKAIRKMEVVFLNAEYDIIIDGSNLINHSEKDFSGPFHWVASVSTD